MHNVNVFSNIFIYSKYILCYITYVLYKLFIGKDLENYDNISWIIF